VVVAAAGAMVAVAVVAVAEEEAASGPASAEVWDRGSAPPLCRSKPGSQLGP
jgi:hypothetical protein